MTDVLPGDVASINGVHSFAPPGRELEGPSPSLDDDLRSGFPSVVIQALLQQCRIFGERTAEGRDPENFDFLKQTVR